MSNTGDDLRFYRANEKPYGAFSSLYRRGIALRDRAFRSVEDAYQSRKPRKPAVAQWLLAAPSPSLVAIAAHSLLHWDISPGWSRGRIAWMHECQSAKFAQHADLRDLLLSTNARRLVEAGSTDSEVNRRWGEVNGVGSNFLGRILMRIRADLGGACYTDLELDEKLRCGADVIESEVCPPLQQPSLSYLASPYNHELSEVRAFRVQAACKVAGALIASGELVFSPIAHNVPILQSQSDLKSGWTHWEQYDLAMLAMARRLLVLKLAGWEESEGVQREISAATAAGIFIEHLTPSDFGIHENTTVDHCSQ